MKAIAALACLLTLAADTLAGEVYGSIIFQNKPLQRASVTITYNQSPPLNLTTDANGVYRGYINGKGRCTLTLTVGGEKISYNVISYDTPVRYDFELVQSNGHYVLIRR